MPHVDRAECGVCPRCRLTVFSTPDSAPDSCPHCGDSLETTPRRVFEMGSDGRSQLGAAKRVARSEPRAEQADGDRSGTSGPAPEAAPTVSGAAVAEKPRRTPDAPVAEAGGGRRRDSAAARVAELEAEVRMLKAEARKLARLAHSDALTGLPNRRALEPALTRELARAARLEQPLCLAVIDLDHFKAVNDTQGHQAGDRLLREATAAWDRQLRAEDMLARNDGDEFTVLLANCQLEEASELIERLRAATPTGQTCSAGVVCWDGSEPPEALIARGDRALYAAKHAGRDLAIAAHP